MAVEKGTAKRVGEYWPHFKKRAIAATIAVQIIATLVVGGSLIYTEAVTSVSILIIMLVATFSATTLLNLLLIKHLIMPLGDIAAALTHISGEPTTVSPPNPNNRNFERDGFKPLLQLIYSVSASRNEATEAAASTTVDLFAALSTLPVGFVMLDQDRNIIYANQAAPVRTNSDGKTSLELLFDNKDTLDDWLDSCSNRDVQAEKIWLRVANKIPGEEDRKIYDISASFQKGKAAEVVLTLINRTNTYQPEDDSLDFIAFAAHELRGPITVIRGYLDVLGDELESTISEEQAELMSRLVVSSNRLSSYINNILNASRYDRRHLKLHLRETSIADIYDTISDDMQLRATSQRRSLEVNLPKDLPTVAADSASIGEVIGNLIDNAIKYSNDGGVVNVTASASSDFVTVSVEDHGIGMPGQVVSNLFHKFYRSHRSRETVAGTGIGLYICKAIVESHGGSVGVKSTEGIGSTFTFSLPIYATVAEKLKANHNDNEEFIAKGDGWIKNHTMYRG